MEVKNVFLGAKAAHNTLLEACFCNDCRARRCAVYRQYDQRRLFNLFTVGLPQLEDRQLMKYHETVLNTIVAGKVYKEICLLNTTYKQFKSWANTQRQFADWDPRELKKFCDKVNEASSVFDNWDIIIQNLMDARLDCLDARRFSVIQFKKARDMGWCLIENENLRERGKKPEESKYSEDKFNEILQCMQNTGILDEIEHNPHIAAMIGKRFQQEMVRQCQNHR